MQRAPTGGFSLRTTRGTARASKRGRDTFLSLVCLGVALEATDAHAYIDPGTGSYAFQIALAGLLAGLYTLKRYWHAIRSKFSELRRRGRSSQDRADP